MHACSRVRRGLPSSPHFFLGRGGCEYVLAGRRVANCGLLGAAPAAPPSAAAAGASAAAAAAGRGGRSNVVTGLPTSTSGFLPSLDRSGRPSTFFTAGTFSSMVWPRLNTLEAAGGVEGGEGGEAGVRGAS